MCNGAKYCQGYTENFLKITKSLYNPLLKSPPYGRSQPKGYAWRLLVPSLLLCVCTRVLMRQKAAPQPRIRNRGSFEALLGRSLGPPFHPVVFAGRASLTLQEELLQLSLSTCFQRRPCPAETGICFRHFQTNAASIGGGGGGPLSSAAPPAGVENINTIRDDCSGPLNQHVNRRSCQGDLKAIYH